MGTSGSFGGSKTGLVPSWVNDAPTNPAGVPDSAPGDGAGGPDGPAVPASPAAYPPIPKPLPGVSLQSARKNITRGARNSDGAPIKRGASQYVSSRGGGHGAARQMKSSKTAVGGIARFANSFVNEGPTETLKKFNLARLAGAPASEVFVALTDMLCPPGGTIDESLARDAMLETIVDLTTAGIGDFDALTSQDLEEFFMGVISRSIEGKILNEVGANSIRLPESIDDVWRAQRILHEFVHGCVQDRFNASGKSLAQLSGKEVDDFVSDLYSAAFDLMKTLGENQ